MRALGSKTIHTKIVLLFLSKGRKLGDFRTQE